MDGLLWDRDKGEGKEIECTRLGAASNHEVTLVALPQPHFFPPHSAVALNSFSRFKRVLYTISHALAANVGVHKSRGRTITPA